MSGPAIYQFQQADAIFPNVLMVVHHHKIITVITELMLINMVLIKFSF